MKKLILFTLLVLTSLNIPILEADETKKEEIKVCINTIEGFNEDYVTELTSIMKNIDMIAMSKKQIEAEKMLIQNIEGVNVPNECLQFKELFLQMTKYMLDAHEIQLEAMMNNNFNGALTQIQKANDLGEKIMNQIESERAKLFQQFQIQE